jgi:hypothetical protein
MYYADLKDLPDARFKRRTGVSKATWSNLERPAKLCREDHRLFLLHGREYRSLAHIAATYHVSELTVSRAIALGPCHP